MNVFTSPPRGCYVAMEVSVHDFVTRAINLHASILDRSIVQGTNTNALSQLQKENMATLFNQIGLWTGRWERFLNMRAVAAPSTPGPVRPRPRPIRAAVPSSPPAKRSRITSQSVSSHRTSRPGPSRSPPSHLSSKPGPSRACPSHLHSLPGPSRSPPSHLSSKPGPSRARPSHLHSLPGPSRAAPPSLPGPSNAPVPAQQPVSATATESPQYYK